MSSCLVTHILKMSWLTLVGENYCCAASSVRRVLTRNTAVVVASAPCFPHGVVDHVADIAKVGKPWL
jgi:glutamate/tyrosine decarboxylase-like PLP-dependent enzyme